MRHLVCITLFCSAAFALQAEEKSPLPDFAIYRTMDAAAPNARAFSFQSVDGKKDITGWFVEPPLVTTKDLYEFKATTLEYSTVPCPGLGVRFTNPGNRALERNTTKEEKAHYLIVADGEPVGQIEGGELWKIGTLRLNLLITLPLDSGELNRTLERQVNQAMKAAKR